MRCCLALFQSTRAVIQAERLCKKNNLSCKVIPVPRSISSECGMALEITDSEQQHLTKLCCTNSIKITIVTLTS